MFKKLTVLLSISLIVALALCGISGASTAQGTHAGDSALKNIIILATGGTIAGTGTVSDYTAGVLGVQAIIDSVPGLDKLANLSSEQLFNIGSPNITANHWLILAKRINELSASGAIDGFVVTHGTDTLEETAYFLHLTVKTDKPVVVVGSMRPATALSADGPMNLYQAVALARSDEAIGRGVMVVLSDGIYSARDVTKVHTFMPDAFSGRDFGLLGHMRGNIPIFYHRNLSPHTTKTPFDVSNLTELPRVGIAYSHTDTDPVLLEFMFNNYDGLVLAGSGNGNASDRWNEKIKEMKEMTGVPLVRSSRVAHGPVDRTMEDIRAGNLNPQKARVLLQLALTITRDEAQIAEFFATF